MTNITRRIAANPSYKWWVYSSVGAAAFITVSDQTGTTLALPRIAHELNADIPTVQWMYLIYTLFISALLLPMGRLSDMLGRRRIYTTGLVVFTCGAALAYFAGQLPLLLTAKAIQGVGVAMIQANGMALMAEAFPKKQRGTALGLYMAGIGTGAVSGPVISGIMIDAWGWRSLYLFITLVGVAEIVLSTCVIRDLVSSRDRMGNSNGLKSFDWVGAILSAGTLVLFLLSMTYGHRLGWSHHLVLMVFSFAALFLAGFIVRELKSQDSMIDLTLFKVPVFSLGIAARFLAFISGSPVYFLMPFYVIQVLGVSASRAAFFMLPAPIMMIITSPLSGRFSDKVGTKWPSVTGLCLWSTALIVFTRVEIDSNPAIVSVGMLLLGAGNGIFSSPNTAAVMTVAGDKHYGVVAALVNMVRTSGNLTGIAIGTTILVPTMTSMGFEPSLSSLMETNGAGIRTLESIELMGSFVKGLHLVFILGVCFSTCAAVFTTFRPELRQHPPATEPK